MAPRPVGSLALKNLIERAASWDGPAYCTAKWKHIICDSEHYAKYAGLQDEYENIIL